jgi:hypothetical protein
MITNRCRRAPCTRGGKQLSFAAAARRPAILPVHNKANFCQSTLAQFPNPLVVLWLKSAHSAGNPEALIYDVAPMTASQRVDSHTRSANLSSPYGNQVDGVQVYQGS